MEYSYQYADPAYYHELKNRARLMRNNPTEAETAIWQALKGKQLGCTFVRQYIIGQYIADFACISHKLIVEIDGPYHMDAAQENADVIRSVNLQTWGFEVMRFTNEQALFERDNVIKQIRDYIKGV